jgi:pilus assembly protein CpaF
MSTRFVAVPSWQARQPVARPEASLPAGPRAREAGRSGGDRGGRAPDDRVPGDRAPGDRALDGRALDERAGDGDGGALDERRDGDDGGGAESSVPDVAALGPLAPFAASGPVTDLFVNGERGLWIDRGAGAELEPAWTADEAEVRALAVRLIARGGRHIDEATPAVDVRLGRGIRVHAVLPPVSSNGTLISVRVPRAAGFPLAALARAGMLDATQEATLRGAVAERRNVLVTGAGGTGKTTLLGAMLAAAPARERIVLIEDVAELTIDHPHVVALEARQANLEGSGRLGLDALLREALRMRPDRIVVGECRGAELRELLAALNTGHDGGAGTLHANSLDDVPARLESLGSIAGMSADAVARQTVSAFDLVVHLERVDGRRRVAAIGRFVLKGDRLTVAPC